MKATLSTTAQGLTVTVSVEPHFASAAPSAEHVLMHALAQVQQDQLAALTAKLPEVLGSAHQQLSAVALLASAKSLKEIAVGITTVTEAAAPHKETAA